ncbi:MAG: tRNA (N6-threonylcarbamoyladenosine(37)-N6)-methyltransferase TrmO [Bacteroidales bacterium]|nr:tRNA (N6-threonylcarbamoyladenosine(37)-N6)-methyltransferase TrmO [Bacteroidales bacterium]
MEIKPIAYYRGPLGEKFGTPRQAGLVPDLSGTVEFCEGFEPAMLDGLEGFDYIWLIWGFSLNRPSDVAGDGPFDGVASKVRPPRLGGNGKMGVFATRSPYRPNPLGLSSVRLTGIDAAAGRLEVLGADLVDGTPIYDIKPYVVYADSHPDARSGFAAEAPASDLMVVWPDPSLRDETLERILSLDPRPAYQDDPSRIYGLSFKGRNISFRVEGDVLTVLSC